MRVEATQQTQDVAQPGKIRRWIIHHDDSWWFIAPYITLAVVLSLVLSLFWLVVVVGVHFVLELIRQWTAKPGWRGVLSRTVWELKLDIGLVLFGLVLALYMEITLGMVGLGAAARGGAAAGARLGTRFVVIQRVLRAILLSLDDLAQVLRVIMRRKGAKANQPTGDSATRAKTELTPEDIREELAAITDPEKSSGWHGNWSKGDVFALGFTTLCLLMIVVAPMITHHTVDSTVGVLMQELHPFPVD